LASEPEQAAPGEGLAPAEGSVEAPGEAADEVPGDGTVEASPEGPTVGRARGLAAGDTDAAAEALGRGDSASGSPPMTASAATRASATNTTPRMPAMSCQFVVGSGARVGRAMCDDYTPGDGARRRWQDAGDSAGPLGFEPCGGPRRSVRWRHRVADREEPRVRGWGGLWRAVVSRGRSDWPVILAAWLLLLCATTLLAAGVLYSDTVARGGLRQAVLAASPEDRAVLVRRSAAAAEVDSLDALVRPELDRTVRSTGGEVAPSCARDFALAGHHPTRSTSRPLASSRHRRHAPSSGAAGRSGHDPSR
jgi:hypothetical protein